MKTETKIIGNGFEQGFSLRSPDGTVKRIGSCDWQDDFSYSVVEENGKFFLVNEGTSEDGFSGNTRTELAPETMATSGYHDDEHGEWVSLPEMAKGGAR